MQQAPISFGLLGGLDLVTPPLKMAPGRVINAKNYEPVEKGYQRMGGFERLDGRPKPSEATYHVLNFDAGTATITEGQTVTGATSGATGKALIDMVVSTGSFGASNAAGYLVLTVVSGTFVDNENLQVAGVTKCVSNGTAAEAGALTDADNTTWSRDAIETARALIGTVTGSGRIRGVWVFGGTKYAVRDNAGGTAGVLYKSTTSGWTAVALGSRVKFQTGTVAIVAGNTVTGASSGASGVVTRVALRTGTYGGGNAAGQLIFASITGAFTNGENLQVGGVTKAVANGGSAAITLPAGGRYEFVNHNFFGASDLVRMYGCNGVGTAFEFDGTVFVPIETGMTTDTPNHIAVHNNQLLLAFAGGSMQNSGVGDPYSWSPITGAAEIGMGDDVTGMIQDYTGLLAIFTRNKVGILYGTDATDFSLKIIANDAGAVEWSIQKIVNPIYHDDRGLRDLRTTQAYGDFKMGTLTGDVEPLIKQKKDAGVTITASLRCRKKGQYWLFWSDGTGIVVYLGRPRPEIMYFDFGSSRVVYATCSSENADGTEILLFGSDDGYVYELDAGTSFDGGEVDAYIRLAFNHARSPGLNKRWHKATLECDATPATTLYMVAEFSYADPEQPPSIEQSFSVAGTGGIWDAANWNEFYWDAPIYGRAHCYLDGIGESISIAIASRSTYEAPHALHGMTLAYSHRGRVK